MRWGPPSRPSVRQTVEAVRQLATPGGVTVRQLADHLQLERSAGQYRVQAARDGGFIVNVEERRGMRPGSARHLVPQRSRFCPKPSRTTSKQSQLAYKFTFMVMASTTRSRVVGTEGAVFGSADQPLLAKLNSAGVTPPGKRLALLPAMQGDFPVRPVEVLHALSSATSRCTTTIFTTCTCGGAGCVIWASLTTTGTQRGRCPCSESARLVAGSRVRNGELRRRSWASGFGVVLARRWFKNALGPGVPIGFIDIDAYLSGSGSGGAIRSDYMLIARDSANDDRYRVRLLECKGTQEETLARSR